MRGPRVPHLTAAEIAARYGLPVSHVEAVLQRAQLSMRPMVKTVSVKEDGQQINLVVTRQGVGPLATPYGNFWQYDFHIDDQWQKYSVLVYCSQLDDQHMPSFKNTREITMRTDSGCETGQMFLDETCECRDQLHLAMQEIVAAGEGMIVNIPRQDGRGKGLPFKLATLMLQQELQVNTVESASMLAEDGEIDARTYAGVIAIMKFFGVPSSTLINLATNNPYKSYVFLDNGYQLASFKPVVVPPTEHTKRHLDAKHDQLGHSGIGEPDP